MYCSSLYTHTDLFTFYCSGESVKNLSCVAYDGFHRLLANAIHQQMESKSHFSRVRLFTGQLMSKKQNSSRCSWRKKWTRCDEMVEKWAQRTGFAIIFFLGALQAAAAQMESRTQTRRSLTTRTAKNTWHFPDFILSELHADEFSIPGFFRVKLAFTAAGRSYTWCGSFYVCVSFCRSRKEADFCSNKNNKRASRPAIHHPVYKNLCTKV